VKESEIGLLLSFEPIRAPSYWNDVAGNTSARLCRKHCSKSEPSTKRKMIAQKEKYWHHIRTCYSAYALSKKSCWFFAREDKGADSHQTPPASNSRN